MNRLRYIFLSLLTVLSLSGCVGELVSNVSKDIQSGEKILVDFSIVLPEDVVKTKVLEETPTINTLHLAVFDDAGYLVEYAEANKVPVNVNEKTEAYTVTLTLSNAKRIIHFIANSVEIPKYGTEVESIGSMVSTDQWDIYWQRKVLEKGITKGPDGKLSDQTRNDLSNIGLVRNFSKLTMSSIAEGFEPLSFYMAKERRRGTVAPYNTATGRFIENYQTYSSLADLQAIGYDGFIPEDTPVDEYIPATTAEFDAVATPFGAASDSYTNFHYLYERETPVSYDEQPFIIVKGNRGGKGPFYYKISLNNADGKSFPILRNFNYGITIKTVSRDGNDTPLKAASSSGSGDISTSMDPTLINISDGTARLFVSYTDTLLVSGGNIKFRYRYLPDVSAGTSANGVLANPETATNAGVYFDVVDKNGNVITANSLIGSVITNAQFGSDLTDGYREVTLTIKDPTATTEWQYLRIYGQKEGDGSIRDVLYRTISFQLMQKQPLIVRCVPKEIELEQGTPITIQTGIPAGFGKAQFPMDIAIEAVNLTLTPNGDNLPVQTGKSLTNSGKPAFWFIRTITYDEYAAMATETVTVNGQRTNYKFFDSHFKSNTAASASQVVATNRYFLDGSDSFTNYTPNVFTPVNMTGSFQAGRDGGKVTLTFNLPTLPSQGDVTILLDGADLDPAVDQPIEQVGTQVVDGKTYGKYIYKPNNTGNQTIKLVSTDQNTGIITAKLSAYHYNDAEATVKSMIWFRFGNDLYSGQTTDGVPFGQESRIVWYVHYENLTSNNLDATVRRNYTSSVTYGNTTYQGYAQSIETIDNTKYIKFISSYDSGSESAAYFRGEIGTYAASFTARDNSGNQSTSSATLKIRQPYVYLNLPDDWYNHKEGIVKVYCYCETADLDNIEVPITGQYELGRPRPTKTTETKVIDGITYYAYTAEWFPATDFRGTITAQAITYTPGTGAQVMSNTNTAVIQKTVKPISAEDITLKAINSSQTISVSGAEGRSVSYRVDDQSIVTVDNNGKVTAKKRGTTTVTISAAETSTVYASETKITVIVLGTRYWTKATSVRGLEGKTVILVNNGYILSNSSVSMTRLDGGEFDPYIQSYSDNTYTLAASGEYYYLTSTSNSNRLRYSGNALNISNSTNNNTNWTMVPNKGLFTLQNRSSSNIYLYSNGLGSISGGNTASEFEIWYFDSSDDYVYEGRVYTIRQLQDNGNTWNKYVYDNNGTLALSTNTTSVSDAHRWRVIIEDNGAVILQNVSTGRYISDAGTNNHQGVTTSANRNDAKPVYIDLSSSVDKQTIQIGNGFLNNWGGKTDNNTALGLYSYERVQIFRVTESK